MTYKLVWADTKVQKVYGKLSSLIQSRIREALKDLAANPRPTTAKQLQGNLKGVWRLRVGDYRILYDIDDKATKVIILDLGHRRQIYR